MRPSTCCIRVDSGPASSTRLGHQGQDFRVTRTGGWKNCPPRSESSPRMGEKGKICSLQTANSLLWIGVCLSCPVVFLPLRQDSAACLPIGRGARTPDSSWGREGRVRNLCQAETQCRKPFGVRGEKDGRRGY